MEMSGNDVLGMFVYGYGSMRLRTMGTQPSQFCRPGFLGAWPPIHTSLRLRCTC